MKHSMAKRSKKKETLRLSLFFSLSGILILFLALNILHKKEPVIQEKKEPEKTEEQPLPESQLLSSPLKKTTISIEKGITFVDLLARLNVSAPEIHRMREEARPVYDLANIKAGQEMRIFCTEDGTIQRIEYDIDDAHYLHLQKDEKEKDRYRAEIREIPYETKLNVISGTIEDNLITAVNNKGEEDTLGLALSDLFAWDIDFYTDPRPGDTFKILFEKKYLREKFVGYGNIIAAAYINEESKYSAFFYVPPDSKNGEYYDAQGNSLKKEFLKSPIPFSRIRITSGFSYRRFHPIRKVWRPHYGVDYAARIGTPVQATADGTVTFAGWNGASGYMVTIRHKNAYETMYLHLLSRKREPGIRKGAKVKQGQTIGYVGSSGEATGSHLDYRVKQRGRYLNPLSIRFTPVAPLGKEYLEDYRGKVAVYSLVLEKPLELLSVFSHLLTLPPLSPLGLPLE